MLFSRFENFAYLHASRGPLRLCLLIFFFRFISFRFFGLNTGILDILRSLCGCSIPISHRTLSYFFFHLKLHLYRFWASKHNAFFCWRAIEFKISFTSNCPIQHLDFIGPNGKKRAILNDRLQFNSKSKQATTTTTKYERVIQAAHHII